MQDYIKLLRDITYAQIALLLLKATYEKPQIVRTILEALEYASKFKKVILLKEFVSGDRSLFDEDMFSKYTFAILTSDEFFEYDLEIVAGLVDRLNIPVSRGIKLLKEIALEFSKIHDENAYMFAKRVAQLLYIVTKGSLDIRTAVY